MLAFSRSLATFWHHAGRGARADVACWLGYVLRTDHGASALAFFETARPCTAQGVKLLLHGPPLRGLSVSPKAIAKSAHTVPVLRGGFTIAGARSLA
ncbi:hypothetical protein [Roseobacter fucihabitans]|uniref:hypothetical protein n=1 Tax=Roseobacter fucihabitans TaxID=1537242 RepID=UPI001652BF80|nr:hypothetical protein [Roseobacter litoralis]